MSPSEASPALDVVIVNYNAGPALAECVRSVLASEGVSVRCILVDNASTDGSMELPAELQQDERLLRLFNRDNLGFSRAVNQGVTQVQTAIFLLLNPDARVAPDTLLSLWQHAQAHPGAGVLGCLVLNPDGSEQRGCRRDIPGPLCTLAYGLRLQFVWPSIEFNHTGRPLPDSPVVVPALSGSCMMIRHAAHAALGGFDEGFFLHFEDLDYCRRMHLQGWQVIFVPNVSIEHDQGGCSKAIPCRVAFWKTRSMLRFLWKHGGWQRLCLPLLLPLAVLHAALQCAVARLRGGVRS